MRAIFATLICGIALGAVLLPAGAPAQTETYEAECTWAAPGYAPHPIDHYRVELEKRIGKRIFESTIYDDLPGFTVSFDLEYGYSYRVRVLAVDVDGREGPWSFWSADFSPDSNLGEHVGEE